MAFARCIALRSVRITPTTSAAAVPSGCRTFSTQKTLVKNFIGGKFADSNATKWFDVHDPATQEVVAVCPQSTPDELKLAVDKAAEAFQTWKEVSIPQRQRVFFKLADIINQRKDKLADIIVAENGKTLADAHGSIFRGLEVVEHATSAATELMGETLGNLARNIDTYSYRQPLGVCAGICPFNFPAMIPMWMFPLGIVAGNTFVLKPSERTPTSAMVIAEWAKEAGIPDGVLNVVHGGKETVDFICTDPAIKAISFVGSNQAGEYIHQLGTEHGKRVQSNMGAKNHGVIMPDADKASSLDQLVGAAFGAAGQRCMALSAAVFVGESQSWIDEFVEKVRPLKLGPGKDPEASLGPMISPQAQKRAVDIIRNSAKQGANVVLDGTEATVDGFPKGNWLGPTVITDVKPHMDCYKEEIFGPVLSILSVDTLDDAIKLLNDHPMGNGCAIFTQSGGAARKFQHEVEVGQIGINLPIPVPLPMFSFTGNKNSHRGAGHFMGKQGIQFFTTTKTITSNWKFDASMSAGVRMTMPTLK